MVKFIQVCASQDDLFALDGEGAVYQYNFNRKTWVTLAANRSPELPRRGDHEPAGSDPGGSRNGA
jgi:hypothetical protein